jgi:hypothetical protein
MNLSDTPAFCFSPNGLSYRCCGPDDGRTEMRKISHAVAVAVIATGFGVWAASSTNPGAPSMAQGIEPFQFVLTANNLPTTEFADYTFVFRSAAGLIKGKTNARKEQCINRHLSPSPQRNGPSNEGWT